ncbi:sodium:solute symporter family protein [Spiractinospora alimapuensis]|uniref:sodium:solute symporter family protein n=1 Tax=Spiractinospora alimapuensis TaxID=2820884 RepID=UPI001F4581A7|nr:sodium:solute symporter family protein [Spiractinospora alimapuensis]QVQ53504.1 sodium:solute symporter family protein [Spiractinospora alimapuensis]
MDRPFILTAVITYLAVMVLIGFWYGRRIKNKDDFLVAGRSLPQWILTGTLLATWTGAGTIIGRANFTYTYGPLASVFYSLGPPLGILIMYLFLARRIRALGKYTVPEIIELRYGRTVRIVAACAIVLAYMSIISEQITALGYILNLAVGVPPAVGEVVGLCLILFTAFVGGILAMAYMDAVSAIVITGAFFGGIVFVLVAVSGFSGAPTDLPADHLTWTGGLTPFQLLGFVLPGLFLFLGDQNMYQRFGAARSPDVARRSALGFLAGDILFYGAVIVLATGAVLLLPGIAPDTAILRLATDAMPLALGAAVMMAATAFIITTGNSFVLSTSTNLVQDIYASLSRRELTSKQTLWATRLTLIAVGLAAYGTSKLFPDVLAIQVFAYTMYGAVITPCLLAVFLTRRVTPAGAIASMTTGALATIGWEFALDKPFEWNSILVSLPLSVTALVVVSLCTSPRPDVRDEPASATDRTS